MAPKHSCRSTQTMSSASPRSSSRLSVGATGTATTSFLGFAHAGCAQSRADRRTGRNAVVDDDCGPARDIRPFAVAEITPPAPLDLGQFGIPGGVEFGLADVRYPDHVVVAHDNGSGTVDHGAHRQFRLGGNAELADQDQIERGVERGCDFGGNRYAAARQREDNRVLILVARERARELPTGIGAINKWHRCSALRIGTSPSLCVP